MSRQDYEAIAKAIREAFPSSFFEVERDAHRRVVDALVRELKETNPQFNGARFRAACGL